MSTINLTQYAKVFTARLRSRVHSQAFAQTFQEKTKKRLSPTAKTAFKKVEELESLVRLYRGTYDPGLRSRAMNLLQTLPLPLSTDEDPHFVLATRVLRVAGSILGSSSSSSPPPAIISTLLYHCARHSFLLDGFNLVKLLQAMRSLSHPEVVDVLRILLPRLQQVLEELTAAEAAEMIHILHYLRLDQQCDLTTLLHVCGRQIKETVGGGISLTDMEKCMRVIPLLPPDVGRSIIVQASPSLFEFIRSERVLHRILSVSASTATPYSSSSSAAGAAEKDNKDGTVSFPSSLKKESGRIEKREEVEGAKDPATMPDREANTVEAGQLSKEKGEKESDKEEEGEEEEERNDKSMTSSSSSSTGRGKATHSSSVMQSTREEQEDLLRQHINLHRTLLDIFTYNGSGLGTLEDFLSIDTASAASASSSCVISTRRTGDVSASLRQLWNELLRAVLDLSLPIRTYLAPTETTTATSTKNRSTCASNFTSMESGTSSRRRSSTTGGEVLPIMRRADVARTVCLLHLCSYRHIPALHLLASRYLTASSVPPEAKRQTPAERGLEELREVGMIVDALGYFLVPLFTKEGEAQPGTMCSGNAANSSSSTNTGRGEDEVVVVAPSKCNIRPSGLLVVLSLLLGEISPRCFSRCVSGGHQGIRMAALGCISKQWESIIRLGNGVQKEDEDEARENMHPAQEEEKRKKWTSLEDSCEHTSAGGEGPQPQKEERKESRATKSALFAEEILPAIEWTWYAGGTEAEGPPPPLHHHLPHPSHAHLPSPSSISSVPPLQRYIRSSSCHQDPSRTARLLHRAVRMTALLHSAVLSGAWSPASIRAMREVQRGLLLDGLVRYYDQRPLRFRPENTSSPHSSRSKTSDSSSPSSSRNTASTAGGGGCLFSPSASSGLLMYAVADQSVREDLTATVAALKYAKELGSKHNPIGEEGKQGQEEEEKGDGLLTSGSTSTSSTPMNNHNNSNHNSVGNKKSPPVLPSWMWSAEEEKKLRQLMTDYHLAEEVG